MFSLNIIIITTEHRFTDIEHTLRVAMGKDEGKGQVGSLGWTRTHGSIGNGLPTRTYCIAQGTLFDVPLLPG